MLQKDIFPTLDVDFHVYINNAINYLKNNYIRLNITTSKIIYVESQKNLWSAFLVLSQNPITSTIHVKEQKNNMRVELEIQLRIIYGNIPDFTLTYADRNLLRIYGNNLAIKPNSVKSIKRPRTRQYSH